MNKKVKLLVIGEFGVGKTSLIKSFLGKEFVDFYDPTYE